MKRAFRKMARKTFGPVMAALMVASLLGVPIGSRAHTVNAAAPSGKLLMQVPAGQLVRRAIHGEVVSKSASNMVVSTQHGNVTVNLDSGTQVNAPPDEDVGTGAIQAGDKVGVLLDRSPVAPPPEPSEGDGDGGEDTGGETGATPATTDDGSGGGTTPTTTEDGTTSTVFSDDNFVTLWTSINLQFPAPGPGGATFGNQQATGGNPGEYLLVRNSVDFNSGLSPSTGVYGIWLRSSASYDPSTQGAINTVDFYEDYIVISGGAGGQRSGPALMQDGQYFTAAESSLAQSSWTALTSNGLTHTDFLRFPLQNVHPDFSETGGPITFGFVRITLTTGPQASAEAGIDNWSVTVHTDAAPTPTTTDDGTTGGITPTTTDEGTGGDENEEGDEEQPAPTFRTVTATRVSIVPGTATREHERGVTKCKDAGVLEVVGEDGEITEIEDTDCKGGGEGSDDSVLLKRKKGRDSDEFEVRGKKPTVDVDLRLASIKHKLANSTPERLERFEAREADRQVKEQERLERLEEKVTGRAKELFDDAEDRKGKRKRGEDLVDGNGGGTGDDSSDTRKGDSGRGGSGKGDSGNGPGGDVSDKGGGKTK